MYLEDIPVQKYLNCGVHICTYVYILCSGIFINYTDGDMDMIRRAIANIIVYEDAVNN